MPPEVADRIRASITERVLEHSPTSTPGLDIRLVVAALGLTPCSGS